MALALPQYPQEPAPGWCADFIGLPHVMGARGPDAWDCWGLCWLVLGKHFGIAAPRYEGIRWDRNDPRSRANCGRAIAQLSGLDASDVKPGKERGGDIIILRMAGNPLHCGIVATPGWMLHSTDGAESALERYDGLFWRDRVEGLHRLRVLA